MNHIKYTSAIVLALCSATAVAQQKRISGHVFNAKDGAVVMANVVEKDKTNRVVSATQTDMSGNFSMTIKNPNNRLEVSYIGYTTARIDPIGARTSFRIEMKDRTHISEVVITGKRTAKSKRYGDPRTRDFDCNADAEHGQQRRSCLHDCR